MFLAAASDLLMLFLSLELMSIPVYALAGFHRASLRSNESAVKYFLIGSFASGLLLYGSALLYGATGSLVLSEIATSFDPENALDLCGAGLVFVGARVQDLVGPLPPVGARRLRGRADADLRASWRRR